jgi:hypothetical protein
MTHFILKNYSQKYGLGWESPLDNFHDKTKKIVQSVSNQDNYRTFVGPHLISMSSLI